MEHVYEIRGKSVFSLEEAQALYPVIFRISKAYSDKVDTLIERIESLKGRNEVLALELERQINAMIQEWQGKIERLGGQPKGLWIADFDSGDGYYCWKFPERAIEHWHKYSDGFSKRIHVSERVSSLQPRMAAVEAVL